MSTFAEDMVTKYETLLSANTGVKSVSVDGQSVSYDDLVKQYQFWKTTVARAAGTKPTASTIKLGGV